jgi:hypothetical protein
VRTISLAMLAGLFAVVPFDAFAQTEQPKGYTGSYAPAGTAPTPYSTGPLPQSDDGRPGLDVAGPDGSTKVVKPVPCSATAQETDGSTTCVGIEKQK